MSWNQNGQQQQNGGGYNGPQQARKIPEAGKGRLRRTREIKRRPDGSQLSPDFNGLINHEGQILSLSIWHEAAKPGPNGQMMPESFSARVSRYDPNQQAQQAPQQQMQYPPPQPPQYGQQPVYAPQHPAPQVPAYPGAGAGYAPAPGYQPPPPASAPPQAPQWGGQPAQGRPPQAQAPGYKPNEVPF